MVATNKRPETVSSLTSRYRKTNNECIRYFYKLRSLDTGAKLELIVTNENLEEIIYETSTDDTHSKWLMVYHQLPDGVNKITIKGTRAATGVSGFSIDDLVIDSCNRIGIYGIKIFSGKFEENVSEF